ncbi:MAG: trehalose-6-phosphate synthase [Candidatus Riflebacteria bacterium]|nr:trehalose-6-phosphate synthase [Candidatus Riflebacteria bacterium]
MPGVVRFLVGLLVMLALLTLTGSMVVEQMLSRWFESDITLRSQLAVAAAKQGLIASWRKGDRAALEGLLEALTEDDRLRAAAAHGPDLLLVAATKEFPASALQQALGKQAREAIEPPVAEWRPWVAYLELAQGRAQVNALPIVDGTEPLGYVVILHDLTYVERRETRTRWLLYLAFAVLAVAASAATAIAARLVWRGSLDQFRLFLRGQAQRPEFRPLLADVQDLVEQLLSEQETDTGGAWTPQRLKQVLRRQLQGEKVIIVANREPYVHDRGPDGSIRVLHPASGLVTALEPVMRACSGVWIGHGSGSADRETSDAEGRVRVPPGEESYFIRRVWLSPEEEKGYYYGFANEGLWPLCHLAHQRPLFRADDWQHYRNVNRKFAEAVCAEADSEDPIVLVQDYHFAMAPLLIRERLPRATILTFFHIPWPGAEQLGICPWRNELLEGMLGSSILGFHTQLHCNNFLDAVDRYLEARIDREQSAVVRHGHTTAIRPYPISIEWPNRWLQTIPPVAECRASVVHELGLATDALLGVGVDRLDYTKGIEERLRAVETLLERNPELRGRFTFVQLAAPSRTAIEQYRLLNERVERLAAQVNERFGDGPYRPVILARAHQEPPTVFRYYRAADLCYVSSLHDGMNLVAKEFVAARDDERGVLVLSNFTGAARELSEALVVNPYDLEEASSALSAALAMTPTEQRDRMRAMRRYLSEFNVYRWAGRMLVDAARLRRRERLAGRLAQHHSNEGGPVG